MPRRPTFNNKTLHYYIKCVAQKTRHENKNRRPQSEAAENVQKSTNATSGIWY